MEQFTKQAIPFSRKTAMSSDAIFKLMLEMCEVTSQDIVLDVACGPGLTACAVAATAAQVTGIDLTPAMLERAKARQAELGLTNLDWQLGDVYSLPFVDKSFSLVLTRFSFHHFLNPAAVLAEMIRVCRPGGRVMVWDSVPDADKADHYNELEKLKDPSHARALPAEELLAIVNASGLTNIRTAPYNLEFEVEKQLAGMFPNPGDEEKIRRIYLDNLTTDTVGMGVHKRGEAIHFHYPTMIVVGTK
ncbi:MAG TPA: methyltransferase domain-containing protein [Blastocatellia bacterium]|nr:methyltransferase domain-containing protein [Blastocatellia bacterium]